MAKVLVSLDDHLLRRLDDEAVARRVSRSALIAEFAARGLGVPTGPGLLNLAARRWHWDARRLRRLASTLRRLGLVVEEPPLERVAHWCAQGLTAYDACYLALAEHRHTILITADAQMLTVGGALTRAL